MSNTRVNRSSPQTAVEALAQALEAASAYNPNDAKEPVDAE